MEASSSSSAPPIQQQGYNYEVFLSFRGEDTRRTFTDHLYIDLLDKGVHTFRDDDELPKGEAIKPELLKAINQSKVSVPILSKGYASSKWCLMELAQMVKCMEAGNQKILPVFYHVEPREVRHLKREYAEAFSEHEKEHCSMVVDEWRTALETVGKLKGWHLGDDGFEGSLRSNVVLEVFKELKKYQHIDITDNVVGIDDHVDEVMDLLDIDIPDVIIGGIWGMAGSGKTTIAKFIYNQLMHKFDYCSFLSNISEASKSRGMELLQAQLVSDVLRHQSEKFFDMHAGKYVLRQRFQNQNKKVLVVLDDVDQAKQLHALLQIICSVLAGSRIIITTRNKNVLEAEPKKADWIYEVKEMDEENALLLFCKRAFKQDFMLPEYDSLSREIVKAIGGVPLAIEVIASYLSGHLENKAAWEEELRRLKHDPKIQERLRVGTDSLNREEKEIFLDIACLFHGMDMRIPVSMWRARELYPVETVNNLLAKCVIKLSESNNLWMHNLLRDLGREAVREENPEEPRERSRLWRSEDGLQVLDDEEGTEKVKAICLARSMELEQRYFSGQTFRQLSRLLFLDLGYANLNGGFERCLRRLKWISWHGVGHIELSIPSELHLKDLAVLDLSESSIGENWGGWSLIQEARKLEVLNLKSCQQLRSTPHFNSFLPLKRLILEDCHELSVVHSSIRQLTALESLNLKNCWSLERLSDELGSLFVLTELVIDKVPIESLPEGMANLETISAKSCEFLKELSLSDYESLKKLNLSHTPIVQISSSSRHPRNLQELDISYSWVSSFPPLMELQKLAVIKASACKYLEGEVPTELGRLTSLRILRLDNTRITSIPESVRYSHLEVLDLGNSKCEETLPELPTSLVNLRVTCRSSMTVIPNLPDLINLKELEFLQCRKLDQLPEGIKRLSKLRRLKLQSTSIVAFPQEIGELCQLRELIISDCDMLESLPELPSGLRRLIISRCSLEVLPNLSKLQLLKRLVLIDCVRLKDIQGFEELELLEELKLCRSLEVLPNLFRIRKLKKLVLSSFILISVIQGLGEMEWLEELHLEYCDSLEALPNLSRLPKLRILVLRSCKRLKVIQGLGQLEWLEKLCLKHCNSLEALPDLSRLLKLRSLILQSCVLLKDIQGLSELGWLDELTIQDSCALEALPNISKLQKLRILVLSSCTRLRDIQGIDDLESLELLTIEYHSSLKVLPNLSRLQKLKRLVVVGSYVLLGVIEGLGELEWLGVNYCNSLEALPNLSGLWKLTTLNLRSCAQLKDIQGLSELGWLEQLTIEHCNSLEVLPYLSRLQNLRRMMARSCALLKVVQGLGELEWLEELRLEKCNSLEVLPNMSRLQKLRIFVLGFCGRLKDIQGLGELEWLEELRLEYCDSLEALPNLFKLQKLRTFVLRSCGPLKDIQGLGELDLLEELRLENCNSLEALPNLSRLQKLRIFVLGFCGRLKDIQGLDELERLEELCLEYCDSLEALPNLFKLQKLRTFVLISCGPLRDIQGLGELVLLEELRLEYCYSLEALPNLSRLQKLKRLVVKYSYCVLLEVIQGLGELERLEELRLEYCDLLQELPNLSRPQKLRILVLRSCTRLRDIQGLGELEWLEELTIENCISLEVLPNLSRLQKLKRLDLHSFYQLNDIQGLSELECLEELSINYFFSLKALPNMARLQRLKKVELRHCRQLEDIEGLVILENLEFFCIDECRRLTNVLHPRATVL